MRPRSKILFTQGGKGGVAGGLPNVKERIDAISKESMERCKEVLTNEQRRMWEEMVGDDFKLEMPKFDFGIKKR